MTRIKTATLLIATLLIPGFVNAGHHEKGNHMMLAAQPGPSDGRVSLAVRRR
jgi:hypothetical protein